MNTKSFEYQCVYLNPTMKLGHSENTPVLFESDNLGECCVFIYKQYRRDGLPIAVYQPAHDCYRQIYRQRGQDGQPRGEGGDFRLGIN